MHNAYLSQIETGRVKEPSVELLANLASVYGVDLWQLMHRAGWVPEHYEDDTPLPEPVAWDLLPRRLFDDLTPDEVDEVVEYVKLLKRRRSRRQVGVDGLRSAPLLPALQLTTPSFRVVWSLEWPP